MYVYVTLWVLLLLDVARSLSGTIPSLSILHTFPWTVQPHPTRNGSLCGAGKRSALFKAVASDAQEEESFLQLGLTCNFTQLWPVGRVLTDLLQVLTASDLSGDGGVAADGTAVGNSSSTSDYEDANLVYFSINIAARIEMSMLNAFYRYHFHLLRSTEEKEKKEKLGMAPVTICFYSDEIGFYVFPLDHHRGVRNPKKEFTGNEYAFADPQDEDRLLLLYRFSFTVFASILQFPSLTLQETSRLFLHGDLANQAPVDILRNTSVDEQTVLALQEEYEALLRRFEMEITDISIHPIVKPTKKTLLTGVWYSLQAFSASHVCTNEDFVAEKRRIAVDRNNNSVEDCRLLGSSCAVALKSVEVHDLSNIKQLPRVLCSIYSTVANHDRLHVLFKTWAHKCTSFLVFSTEDDDSLPAIKFPHYGEEVYSNMWIKVRSMWKYIGAYYAQEFDWFLVGGDDLFYVMENLYVYLATDPVVLQAQANDEPLYIGRPFTNPDNHTYNSGGPGYLLNRVALQALSSTLQDLHSCAGLTMDSGEDMYLGYCLKSLGITPINTRDKVGRERFHIFPPGLLYTYIPDSRLTAKDWFFRYDQDIKVGIECCSQHSVSFHYISPTLMEMLADFLYYCPVESIADFYASKDSPNYFDRIAYSKLFTEDPALIIDE